MLWGRIASSALALFFGFSLAAGASVGAIQQAKTTMNAPAYIDSGCDKYSKGDLDGAIADENEALKLDPRDPYAYNNRGVALQAGGDLEGALADFDLAMRINPQFSEAERNRAGAKWRAGDVFGALADLF
jgi:tetratricopeptide (TPR) repeat protein